MIFGKVYFNSYNNTLQIAECLNCRGKIIWNNLINILALLPAVMYLGINLGGGASNLVIGLARTAQEAFSGEFFGLRSWSKAVAYYTANIVPLMLNWGNKTPNHKLSLILDKLDI